MHEEVKGPENPGHENVNFIQEQEKSPDLNVISEQSEQEFLQCNSKMRGISRWFNKNLSIINLPFTMLTAIGAIWAVLISRDSLNTSNDSLDLTRKSMAQSDSATNASLTKMDSMLGEFKKLTTTFSDNFEISKKIAEAQLQEYERNRRQDQLDNTPLLGIEEVRMPFSNNGLKLIISVRNFAKQTVKVNKTQIGWIFRPKSDSLLFNMKNYNSETIPFTEVFQESFISNNASKEYFLSFKSPYQVGDLKVNGLKKDKITSENTGLNELENQLDLIIIGRIYYFDHINSWVNSFDFGIKIFSRDEWDYGRDLIIDFISLPEKNTQKALFVN